MTAGPYCDGCGKPIAGLDHSRCRARRATTDPPRFCASGKLWTVFDVVAGERGLDHADPLGGP
jgi:hypothetical protein